MLRARTQASRFLGSNEHSRGNRTNINVNFRPKPSTQSSIYTAKTICSAIVVTCLICILFATSANHTPTFRNTALSAEVLNLNERDTTTTHALRSNNSNSISASTAADTYDPNQITGITKTIAIIAYAVTLSGCNPNESLSDGAAVLRHSIALQSHPLNPTSYYGFEMYALVHPNAMHCSDELSRVGYQILERDTPVKVEDIRGEFLRENVGKNGCCGETEFVKLWAYTLVDHLAVVHLDLDTLVLQPMDHLFDAMIATNGHDNGYTVEKLESSVMFNKPLPTQIDAFFTRDYNMAKKSKPVGVQGGFLVLRPSQQTFDDFLAIIKEGDYRRQGGWGGKDYGPFYGAMTFQGIVPYYYDVIQQQLHQQGTTAASTSTAVELTRCEYNAMVDNPRDQKTVNDVAVGNCRDGTPDCEDCRLRPIQDIVTAHFTLCQKPWHCLPHDNGKIQHRLCRELVHEWFMVRKDLETGWMEESKRLFGGNGKGDEHALPNGTFQTEQFFGFCNKMGQNGYIPMKVPSHLV